MHPIAFEIGNFAIRWYGIMAAVGFLIACWIITLNRKKAGMTTDQATSLVMVAMIAGVIGARLFYVIQFFSQFQGNLWKVIRIDQGGLVFYGGFFLALVSLIVFCRINKLDIVRVFDVVAPALAIGHACGRIGCFLNGCCYGKPTECALGVVYPHGSAPALRYGSSALHPVQLYEAGANVLIFIALFYLVRKGRRGMAMGTYLAVYGLMRFADEFFRGDHEQFLNGLTPAQVIGLILVPVGIGMAVYFAKHDKKSPEISN